MPRTLPPPPARHFGPTCPAPVRARQLTRLHVRAQTLDILSARLCQDHVVFEVGHLHLLKVRHLLGARLVLDVVQLVGQAAQHLAAARVERVTRRAHHGAQRCDVRLARRAQTVVEAVVLGDLLLVRADLDAAPLAKVLFVLQGGETGASRANGGDEALRQCSATTHAQQTPGPAALSCPA
eukprot:365130-Chlamydomonas_euryale.AAC.15